MQEQRPSKAKEKNYIKNNNNHNNNNNNNNKTKEFFRKMGITEILPMMSKSELSKLSYHQAR